MTTVAESMIAQFGRTYEEYLEIQRAYWTRCDVVREGPREPLPDWLRILVLRRDNFTCRWCWREGGRLEVDHIVPWSAGGSDVSWNLRTLCYDCNQRRSNYRTDMGMARVLPIVLACPTCTPSDDLDDDGPLIVAWCAHCGDTPTLSRDEVMRGPANREAAS